MELFILQTNGYKDDHIVIGAFKTLEAVIEYLNNEEMYYEDDPLDLTQLEQEGNVYTTIDESYRISKTTVK